MENRMINDQFEVNENNILIKYHEKEGITEVVIPDSVIEIGNHAFYDCENLTSITIPKSVTKIGVDAFMDCENLTSITIPNSVTTIESFTFAYCENLTNIIIPDSIKEIGVDAFSNCINLKSITIPNSVTKIGIGAFSDCQSLTSITIPNSVIEIGDGAFAHCKNLTNIIIPDSVTTIGMFAIYFDYIKEINLCSYKVFSLLDDDLKVIAIISTIKNYYTGKIKYNTEDMKLFKEYIKENKIEIFEYAKENKEIINIILKEIDNFLTLDDTLELLLKVNCDVEIKAMLTEYSNKIRDGKVNQLDELDLGDFEETTTENEDLGKTR